MVVGTVLDVLWIEELGVVVSTTVLVPAVDSTVLVTVVLVP